MKLDRNLKKPRRGKYALIKLRISSITPALVKSALASQIDSVQVEPRAIDFGNSLETDFFVIRLKDKYAEPALKAYAEAAMKDDSEYAEEIKELARLAHIHPSKRKPD